MKGELGPRDFSLLLQCTDMVCLPEVLKVLAFHCSFLQGFQFVACNITLPEARPFHPQKRRHLTPTHPIYGWQCFQSSVFRRDFVCVGEELTSKCSPSAACLVRSSSAVLNRTHTPHFPFRL